LTATRKTTVSKADTIRHDYNEMFSCYPDRSPETYALTSLRKLSS
jgi:hypothetical protein